jgi:hypothetical protein
MRRRSAHFEVLADRNHPTGNVSHPALQWMGTVTRRLREAPAAVERPPDLGLKRLWRYSRINRAGPQRFEEWKRKIPNSKGIIWQVPSTQNLSEIYRWGYPARSRGCSEKADVVLRSSVHASAPG